MFAGHIGVGLALGRAERRVNVAVFVGAALLLDAILWLLVLAGWESVAIPADFERSRQPVFDFPVSHGLPRALPWSALAAECAFLQSRRHKAGDGSSRWRGPDLGTPVAGGTSDAKVMVRVR